MNIRFLFLILFLSTAFLSTHAQNREDSLFLQRMTSISSSPKLIEGKSYILENSKLRLSPEYYKSNLVREKDTPTFYENGELKSGGVPYTEFGNNPIIFKKVKMDKVKVGTENRPCFILLFTCGKQNYYAYEFNESMSREKHGLIEADFVNEVNKLLVGKTLYTKSTDWIKVRETVREIGCKYCPVTVTRVKNDRLNYFFIYFKADNQEDEYLFDDVMLGGERQDFVRYLTFTNPKEKYPDVSQERWEQIMAQKVRKGFTPDEVKIAYGKPYEVYTEDDDETWTYYNINKKDYAITFKDGIVDKVVSQTSGYR